MEYKCGRCEAQAGAGRHLTGRSRLGDRCPGRAATYVPAADQDGGTKDSLKALKMCWDDTQSESWVWKFRAKP